MASQSFGWIVDIMRVRNFVIIVLACLLTLGISPRYSVPPANAIGVANVVVTSVYWGSDPTSPSAAHPGDVNVQLSMILSNVGDDVARGVNATLFLGPPITYTYFENGTQYSGASASKVAGDMVVGQSFTISFTVSIDSNAKEGIYRYDLQLAYKSARELQQVNKDMMIDVPIWKGELHIQNILTLPTKIYPDSKQVLVKVWVANSGRGTAKDIQVRLDLTPPFTPSSSGSDRIFVGNIPAGQVSEADFIVDVNANTFGQYPLNLVEEVEDKLIPIGVIPLYINEKVKLEILSVTPSTVHVGDSGDVIRVELKNTGSVKADSVRVQLRVGNFFTGTLTDFLGTMLAGETKVAFFTVDIDSKTLPRRYNLDLRIDWTQDDNALDDTQTLSVTVDPPAPPVTLIALGVIVLIAVVGYFVVKRRRMKASQTSTK